jgi:DNA-binding MarR family transcriptional regulator
MSLDAEHFQALAGFRLAMRRFLAAAEGLSKTAGITQQQYQALLAVRAWPGRDMTISDLASELLLTHHATVQLVNRMAQVGMILRHPSSVDRRQVLLRLTPEGFAMVQDLAEQHLCEILKQGPLITRSLRRLRQLAPGADDAAEV